MSQNPGLRTCARKRAPRPRRLATEKIRKWRVTFFFERTKRKSRRAVVHRRLGIFFERTKRYENGELRGRTSYGSGSVVPESGTPTAKGSPAVRNDADPSFLVQKPSSCAGFSADSRGFPITRPNRTAPATNRAASSSGCAALAENGPEGILPHTEWRLVAERVQLEKSAAVNGMAASSTSAPQKPGRC